MSVMQPFPKCDKRLNDSISYTVIRGNLFFEKLVQQSSNQSLTKSEEIRGLTNSSFSHTESRLVTAETELTKERENNRLKIGRLENTIERMTEELKMKSAESAQLSGQLDLSQQKAVEGHPAVGK